MSSAALAEFCLASLRMVTNSLQRHCRRHRRDIVIWPTWGLAPVSAPSDSVRHCTRGLTVPPEFRPARWDCVSPQLTRCFKSTSCGFTWAWPMSDLTGVCQPRPKSLHTCGRAHSRNFAMWPSTDCALGPANHATYWTAHWDYPLQHFGIHFTSSHSVAMAASNSCASMKSGN